MNSIVPRVPDSKWLEKVLVPSLRAAPGYRIDVSQSPIKLDQNESPWDVPAPLKQRITERLLKTSWNRYPSAYSEDLSHKLAAHCGVAEGHVLVGPGSNYLLSLLLTSFTKHIIHPSGTHQNAKLWLARPSFPHCEAQCAYEGIPFVPWNLTDDLEYDPEALSALTPGSVVIFATPNNPVGNSMSVEALSQLLARFPESLFIADEAYYEYSDQPLTGLLEKFSNLILVRTFSKTMASASVRIGYLLASSAYLNELKKLRPPFLMNVFQNIVLDEMLSSSEMKAHVASIVEHTRLERNKLYQWLETQSVKWGMTVKASEANFFLLKWQHPDHALQVYQHLLTRGIQVRNVSGAPRLAGCLRVTIGTTDENNALREALSQWHPKVT